ncbi:MAG: peptide deformylase [Nitrospirae bacterium]|nr:peptide deformylase [Nitrospirota bacterium]
MVRDVLYYPDAQLRQKAEAVREVDDSVRSLIRDLTDTMYRFSGVGLAAPQIGVLRRVLVIDVSWVKGEKEPVALINPEIRSRKGSIVYEEGCLSLPGFNAKVTRSSRVKVGTLGLDGRPVEIEAEDMKAIAIQHEMDHLDGVLFIDRVAKSVRDLYDRRLRKWQEEFYGTPEQRRLLLEDHEGARL